MSNQQQQQPTPAQLNFQEVPVQTLEQLRPRLTQLTHSLRKFEESLISTPNSLPNWSQLQNQYNVILSQLTSFSKTLDVNKQVLRSTNVYPNTEFETTQFEGLLTTMLRKKHLPEVEEWIDSSKKSVGSEIPGTKGTGEEGDEDAEQVLMLQKDDRVSTDCFEIAEELLKEYVFGGYLTKKEIDDGVTFDQLSVPSPETKKVGGEGLSGDDIYRFIYQGLDSGVNIN